MTEAIKTPSAHTATRDDEATYRIFNPGSIALIGASNKSRWSSNTLHNLRTHGFAGEVYLVNPKGGQVHGQHAVGSIADLPDGVDLAYVMVPTGSVNDVLEELADKGIGSAVVLTAGFSEVGAEGAALERRMVEIAAERGMTVLGPNCNGFVNATARATPYGLQVPEPLAQGGVGMVLQSGALTQAVISFAQAQKIGLSMLVAMGNEATLSMTDVIHYLVEDPYTRVITLFIESIRDPEEFAAAADAALRAGKPVIALKVGRSQAGARVAKAHTGALVGDDRVVEAALRQHGVLSVSSLEDLLITAALLDATGPLPGSRAGVITASGGACEILADRAEDEGVEIPDFSERTRAELRGILPEFASPQNPLDTTGYVVIDPTAMTDSLRVVASDDNVDLVVLLSPPELPREPSERDEQLLVHHRRTAEIVRACSKPVVVLSQMLTDITAHGRAVAEQVDYPFVVGGLEHGITAIGHAVRWSAWWRESREWQTSSSSSPVDLTGGSMSSTWAEREASSFLAKNGIPVVPNEVVVSADDAVAVAELMGYPVALKLAADLEHKSDIGGVKLDLRDVEAVRAAYQAVVTVGEEAGVLVRGALVQPMRSPGTELLVGVVADPLWGRVMAIGFGGVLVEVLQDSQLLVLPATKWDVRRAITSLRCYPALQGYRGSAAADVDALVDVVAKVGEIAQACGDRLESLEINPLRVDEERIEALDALVTWKDQ